jgi:hypothetical protein
LLECSYLREEVNRRKLFYILFKLAQPHVNHIFELRVDEEELLLRPIDFHNRRLVLSSRSIAFLGGRLLFCFLYYLFDGLGVFVKLGVELLTNNQVAYLLLPLLLHHFFNIYGVGIVPDIHYYMDFIVYVNL